MSILGNLTGGIGKALGGATKLVGGISFGPLLPWIVAAVAGGIAVLMVSNALLRADVARCHQAAATHAAEDESLAREAVERQRAKEDSDRAARLTIGRQFQEIRDELENENAALRADLASGRQRVRQSLCAPSTGNKLPTAGPAAGASEDKPRDLASSVGRVSGAAARKDADYAELLAIALSDRRTCGVAP